MTESAAPKVHRIIRMLSLAVALVAAVLLVGAKPALAEPITGAQALADALNAATPDKPVATVSADGATVTLTAPATVTGDDALDIAVPAGQALGLDLGGNTLTLENGGTTATAQLVVSGEGTLAITAGEGGSLVSKTADGTIPAVSVPSGSLSLEAPLTLETPIALFGQSYGCAVDVCGGTLVLGKDSGVTGEGALATALVKMTAGELDMQGGTLHADNENVAPILALGGTADLSSGTASSNLEYGGYGAIVRENAVVTISGDIAITGMVEASDEATVTVEGGSYIDFINSFDDSVVKVMPSPEGQPPVEFGSPVPLECLDASIAYAEYDYTGTESRGSFSYFATLEAAEADAAQYPGAAISTVTENAYVCGVFYADDAESANEYYANFYEMVRLDKPDHTFTGPQMIVLAAQKSTLDGTFTCKLGDRVLDQEPFRAFPDPDRPTGWLQMFFDVCQPDAPVAGLPQMGMGECTVEFTDTSDPSNVYASSSVAFSQVTMDLDGGTLPAGVPDVLYCVQGDWSMSKVPTRAGYKLTGWTSAPTPGMVEWNDEWGWGYTVPKEPQAFTFTAQWEPEVVDVYRLWMPASGAHLLTTDPNEVRVLTEQYGWKDEGEVFTVYGGPVAGSTPVTRLLNPNNGDHLYTTSANEVARLTELGWRDEGVKFYGTSDTAHPVYRLWNSLQTADGGLGSHLWTPDFNEYTTLPLLPPVGAWKGEGVAWYAVGLPS